MEKLTCTRYGILGEHSEEWEARAPSGNLGVNALYRIPGSQNSTMGLQRLNTAYPENNIEQPIEERCGHGRGGVQGKVFEMRRMGEMTRPPPRSEVSLVRPERGRKR
jgi:hypothetical protein